MADKQGRGVIPFDKANSGRRLAGVKDVGKGAHGLEVEFRLLPRGRSEEVLRHDKIGGIGVRNTLGRCRIAWSEFFCPTDERLAAMVVPMPQFVRDWKTLATIGTALVDGDNSRIVAADDPCLESIKRTLSDASTKVKRYRLKVDLAVPWPPIPEEGARPASPMAALVVIWRNGSKLLQVFKHAQHIGIRPPCAPQVWVSHRQCRTQGCAEAFAGLRRC
jgi:hypothetical protein